MRIGIDAHIILPKHKRYSPKIAEYTEQLIQHIPEADPKGEHTWVLFFDQRMEGTKKMQEFEKFFESKFGKEWRKIIMVKHFPFVQYRKFLPVVYSHMLVSSFLTAARLDVFHSPEGLIPYLYPGKIVTTFHYVPRGVGDSGIFVRTFMLGARLAFWQLCKRASRIIVASRDDKQILVDRHKYPGDRVVVMEKLNMKKLVSLYEEIGMGKNRSFAKKP